jgi:hypothetical protein
MAGKWIQNSTERMKEKGTEGSFTRIARRMGMSTGAAARRIMANKDEYQASTVKKANWAKNVAG